MTDQQNFDPVPAGRPEDMTPVNVPNAVEAAEEAAHRERLRELGLLDDEEYIETSEDVLAERDDLRRKISEATDRLTRAQKEQRTLSEQLTEQKRKTDEIIASTLQQLNEQRKAELQSFLKEALPIVENFVRGITAIPAAQRAEDPRFEKIVQGLEKTLAQLSGVFNKSVLKKENTQAQVPDAGTTVSADTAAPQTPVTAPAAQTPEEILAERDVLRKKLIETIEPFAASQQERLKLLNRLAEQKSDAGQLVSRTQRQVDEQKDFVLEKFLKEILPVVDNLERGLGAISLKLRAEDAKLETIAKDIETALAKLTEVFNHFGLKQINPLNQPFDSEKHEAISMDEGADVEVDTVVAVVQKGYELKGRVIRHAKVMVKT